MPGQERLRGRPATSSSRPRLAHIPVVLLTGAFEPVDQARAAEAGCDGVLAKPFEPQLVIGRVKELLARPSATRRRRRRRRRAPRSDAIAGRRRRGRCPPNWPRADASPRPWRRTTISIGSTRRSPSSTTRAGAATGGPPTPAPSIRPASTAFDAERGFAGAVGRAPGSIRAGRQRPPTCRRRAVAVDDSAVAPPTATEPVPATDSRRRSAPTLRRSRRLRRRAAAAASSTARAARVGRHRDAALRRPRPRPTARDAVARRHPSQRARGVAAARRCVRRAARRRAGRRAAAAPVWPSARHRAAPVVTDELVEQVTRRVLDHLSDRVVRETVAEIVSQIAERLVREEIERIKASLK